MVYFKYISNPTPSHGIQVTNKVKEGTLYKVKHDRVYSISINLQFNYRKKPHASARVIYLASRSVKSPCLLSKLPTAMEKNRIIDVI